MFLGFMLSFGTALCRAVSDITLKQATTVIAHDEIVILIQRAVEVLIAVLVVVTLILVAYPLPHLSVSPFTFLGTVILASTFNFSGFYLSTRALRLSDVSLVSPISQLTPAILLVTSPLMIGETVSAAGALGVVCVVFGAYVLGFKKATLSLKTLGEPLSHLAHDYGVRLALCASVLYGISANFDKIGVTMSDPFTFTIASGLVMALGIVSYTWIAHPTRLSISKSGVRAGLLPGLSGGIGSLLQMIAISIWPVAYVISIKRLSSVFSVISGSLFFNEQNAAPRLIGSAIMVVGTAVIVLYG